MEKPFVWVAFWERCGVVTVVLDDGHQVQMPSAAWERRLLTGAYQAPSVSLHDRRASYGPARELGSTTP